MRHTWFSLYVISLQLIALLYNVPQQKSKSRGTSATILCVSRSFLLCAYILTTHVQLSMRCNNQSIECERSVIRGPQVWAGSPWQPICSSRTDYSILNQHTTSKDRPPQQYSAEHRVQSSDSIMTNLSALPLAKLPLHLRSTHCMRSVYLTVEDLGGLEE